MMSPLATALVSPILAPADAPAVPADGVRAAGERAVRLPHPPVPHVRVHDQLHPQTQAPPGEVHDEQRPGEFHHPAGTCPHPPQIKPGVPGPARIPLVCARIKPGVPCPGRFVLTTQMQQLGLSPCNASPE